MYKRYNLNELAESIQVLKEKNTREGLEEEVGLLVLLGKIGFDRRDIQDFAEYCGLRLYDSKKYNEDFKYNGCLEKSQFKKYLQKKIEKLSGILERLDEREPVGKWKKETKKTCKNIKSKTVDISPRSNEKFGIALGKLIGRSSIDVEMLGSLIDCEVFKIQGYLTGRYKDPPKEFIEEISDFFDVDPRHFKEYKKHLGKNYKEDRPITLVNHRITKKRREIFELPEQSDEEFKESVRKLIGASGIEIDKLASIMHCAEASLFECWSLKYSARSKSGKLFKGEFIERISKFFNICPGYFKEYRENEIEYKILKEHLRREKIRERERKYYKNNPEKIIEIRRRYYKKHPGGMGEGYKRFKENNPRYSKQYYKNNSEKIRKYSKQYYKNNTEYFKEYYKKNQDIILKKRKEEYYEKAK